MGIKNDKVMVGRIVGDPRLTYSEKTGVARFYARVRVNHWQREDDGNFTKQGQTFHDLVVRYDLAEVAYGKFAKHDDFIATGEFRKFTDAENAEREEFRATTISHNPTTTDYTINRGKATGVEHDALGLDRSKSFERPEQTAPAHESAALAR
ncbi:single-stranded DNA-binding protein [Microlunatus parietis]|uniref:Single-stranded DNA-binding protein n=1 Tax=Microlunatus parietis TaxID=682979 RepID=A0A7Y9LCV3_9ACTN|nr:single-stranded DNA-binding protein [Microlunatus parietis]NYE72090.1 single-stranded DNA-binding protein [Microlunatus parietis]